MNQLSRLLQLIRDAPASKWWLIAGGLIPLLGALFFDWNLGVIMLAFWLENVVVGIYSIIKMGFKVRWGALFMVPFFVFHYGIFTVVHGVFVASMFVAGDVELGLGAALSQYRAELGLVIASLMLSHGYSFASNFIASGEWNKPMGWEFQEGKKLGLGPMGAAYKRVVILHLTIIFGAFVVLATGARIAPLILLVVLKIVVDLVTHAKEHRRPDIENRTSNLKAPA